MESESGTYGRHLVAARDMARGEAVFVEPPLVVGPWAPDVPVCIVCLDAEAALGVCPRCGFDICGDCRRRHDGGEECVALSRARGLRELPRGIKYPALTILRMLRLRVAIQ